MLQYSESQKYGRPKELSNYSLFLNFFLKMKKVIAIALALGLFSGVYAADNTDVTITVNEGELTIDITDADGNTVATPGVTMSAVTSAFSDATSTGTLGEGAGGTNERITAYNPRTNGAFTVSIQSSDTEWLGATDVGDSPCIAGQTEVVLDDCRYNMGFANGGLGTGATAAGVATLTVDPSGGTMEQATPDPDQTPNPWSGLTARGTAGAPDNGLSLGASTVFGTTAEIITLFTSTDVVDEGNDQAILTLTGVGLTQNVPAGQAADTGGYSINLLLTIA